MTKIPVYMMPGLAASSRIFENIILDEALFEVVWLDWMMPLPNESLVNYSKRFIAQKIHHANPVLIGVSFGGIIVQEMARLIPVHKVIIISSVSSEQDFPKRMKWAKATKLYKIIPTRLAKHFGLLAKIAPSKKVKNRIQLYRKYLSVNDTAYLDWALDKIINWKAKPIQAPLIHIHGTYDAVFPIQYITSNYLPIRHGTHIMILNRYRWFNQHLPAIILE